MSAQDQIQILLDKHAQDVVSFLFSKLDLESEKEEEMKNALSRKYGIFSSSSSSSPKKEKTEAKSKDEKEKPDTKKKSKKENGEKHSCSKMITPKGSKELKQCSKQGTNEKGGKWFCKAHYDKEIGNDAKNDIKKESLSDDEPEKEKEEDVPKTKPEKTTTSKLKIGEGLKTEKIGDYTCLKGTRVALDKNIKALGTVSENKVLQNGVFSDNDKKMLHANNIEIVEEDDDDL
jgi:hypothetical protein